jgi:hypothetical protein
MSIETRATIRQLESLGDVQLSSRRVRCYRLDHILYQLSWPMVDLLTITTHHDYGSDAIASLFAQQHHSNSPNNNINNNNNTSVVPVKVVLTSSSTAINNIMVNTGLYRTVGHFGSHSLYIAAINATSSAPRNTP